MIYKERFDNDDHYDGVNKIEYLVIHDTGNGTDSDEGNANYFCTGTRNASAHYFIDDDSCTQVVRDLDGAFHCGDGHNMNGINNRNSLSFEMCRVNGTVTKKTEENTIELIKRKMKEYNVPLAKVVRHFDASEKPCPKSFSDNNWTRWFAFKAKLLPIIKPVVKSSIVLGVVNVEVLNVRGGAGMNFKVIGKLGKGERVKIAKVVGSSWYHIYFGNHGGYVASKYITKIK